MNINLILHHKEFNEHTEHWFVEDQKVLVKSYTPHNKPSYSEAVFTKEEALRNYALLTSKTEGWELTFSDDVWHSFVESK